jgi:malate dehydrogenase
MVPLTRYTSVSGFPINELLDKGKVEQLVDRTRKGGAEVINYLKTGSAFYAPAASTVKMVESIVKDERRFLPASVYLDGEYGYNNIFLGVPVFLGAGGVKKIIELPLTEDEKAALDSSARAVEEGVKTLESLYEQKIL